MYAPGTEDPGEMSEVVLSDMGRGANAYSKKRRHCDRWSLEETCKFYLVGLLMTFFADLCMYVCMYVCVYVCMYVYMCVCIVTVRLR
jgi:hypothetical protein